MLNIPDADSAENGTGSEHCVVTPLYCVRPPKPGDPPVLNDSHSIRLLPGSRIRSIYGGIDTIEAGHFCNYGVNPEYLSRFEAAGLTVSGLSTDTGEVRAMEIRDHPFYIATLFHPQLESRPGAPSPVVDAYVRAVVAWSPSIR